MAIEFFMIDLHREYFTGDLATVPSKRSMLQWYLSS